MNNKVADQTAGKRRLLFTFVVRKQQNQGFLCLGPYDVEAQAFWLCAWYLKAVIGVYTTYVLAEKYETIFL